MDKNIVWKEISAAQLIHGATLVRRDPEALKHVSNSVLKSLLQTYDKLLALAGEQAPLIALGKRIFVDLSALKLGIDTSQAADVAYDSITDQHSDILQKLASVVSAKA